MSRIEEKILKIIGEYYGGEVDVDDDFFDNICTNEFEMFELIAKLENEIPLKVTLLPESYRFDYIDNFIKWVVNNIEK